MTPEERISLTKEKYPSYKIEPNETKTEVLSYFNNYKDYKEALKIYWYYQSLYRLSPSSNYTVPVFNNNREAELWGRFHAFMRHEYVNPYGKETNK